MINGYAFVNNKLQIDLYRCTKGYLQGIRGNAIERGFIPALVPRFDFRTRLLVRVMFVGDARPFLRVFFSDFLFSFLHKSQTLQ